MHQQDDKVNESLPLDHQITDTYDSAQSVEKMRCTYSPVGWAWLKALAIESMMAGHRQW
jgi:hypothetical protein